MSSPSPAKTDTLLPGRPSLDAITALTDIELAERKTSTPDISHKESSPGTPHTESSPHIPDEAIPKLDLGEKDDTKEVVPSSSRTEDYSEVFETEPKIQDSARSLKTTEITEDISEHDETDLTTPREKSPELKAPVSARSAVSILTEQITEELESENESRSERSEKYETQSQRSEISQKSESSYTTTESRSQQQKDHYSSDFSTSSSQKTLSQKQVTDKEKSKKKDEDEVSTDDEISEILSTPESEKSDEKVKPLTFDLHKDEEEGDKQTEKRDESREELEKAVKDIKDVEIKEKSVEKEEGIKDTSGRFNITLFTTCYLKLKYNQMQCQVLVLTI